MAFSSIGRLRLSVNFCLLFLNLVIVALAVKINRFQDYFFVADVLPLTLSAITLGIVLIVLVFDLGTTNFFTSRAPFQIGLYVAFTCVWLVASAFSTHRWRHLPAACDTIPSELSNEIAWCKDVQALKAFLWIQWILLFTSTIYTTYYVLTQSSKGHKHIWTVSLSRYLATPVVSYPASAVLSRSSHPTQTARDSDFVQYEKFP